MQRHRPSRSRAIVLPALVSLTLAPACSRDTGNPPPLDHYPVATEGMGMSMSMTEGGGSDDTSGSNCNGVTCSGHGGCEIGEDDQPLCACDVGYKTNEAGDECIVDETCIKISFLEDRCRQLYNGPAAVSLFFALDFCSGTAVTPAKFEELGLSFQVLESGEDIANNVESESEVLTTSVESYVTLVVDVSDSVTQSKELPALVAELRSLVAALQPGATDPDVYLSVYVFGRFVAEYVPFTRDFAAVDGALAQIETDPASVVSLVNGEGTALYEAVAKGINRTQRIRDMRDAVSWGGVLSTGTVVVITDGQDSSNSMLDTALLQSTLNQVISIGISNAIDDEDLEKIGIDGSFLAPTPADWAQAFDEVAQRVAEYPDRAYLLAYCSSATSGDPEVEVNVVTDSGIELTVQQTAVCTFKADLFSSDPGVTCGTELFLDECRVRECGGLTGCGACADDQCCDGVSCDAPVSADARGGPGCGGVDELCSATGQVCVEDACVAPAAVGSPCEPACLPGEGWCDPEVGDPPGTCTAVRPLGALCDKAAQCESLNCQKTNPDNELEVPTCQLPALAHDRCEGSGAVQCEEGAYCQGTTCEPKEINAESCSGAEQCRSGQCESPVQSQVCTPSNVCYWAWDEKVPS